MTLGAYVLTLGYIQVFIVFYYSKSAQGLKRLLAGLGRLSLSNYLAQSIICTTIFLFVWTWFIWTDRLIVWTAARCRSVHSTAVHQLSLFEKVEKRSCGMAHGKMGVLEINRFIVKTA